MDGVYYSSIKLSNQGKPPARGIGLMIGMAAAEAEKDEIKKKRVRDAVSRLSVSRDRSNPKYSFQGEVELPAQAKRPRKLLPGEN